MEPSNVVSVSERPAVISGLLQRRQKGTGDWAPRFCTFDPNTRVFSYHTSVVKSPAPKSFIVLTTVTRCVEKIGLNREVFTMTLSGRLRGDAAALEQWPIRFANQLEFDSWYERFHWSLAMAGLMGPQHGGLPPVDPRNGLSLAQVPPAHLSKFGPLGDQSVLYSFVEALFLEPGMSVSGALTKGVVMLSEGALYVFRVNADPVRYLPLNKLQRVLLPDNGSCQIFCMAQPDPDLVLNITSGVNEFRHVLSVLHSASNPGSRSLPMMPLANHKIHETVRTQPGPGFTPQFPPPMSKRSLKRLLDAQRTSSQRQQVVDVTTALPAVVNSNDVNTNNTNSPIALDGGGVGAQQSSHIVLADSTGTNGRATVRREEVPLVLTGLIERSKKFSRQWALRFCRFDPATRAFSYSESEETTLAKATMEVRKIIRCAAQDGSLWGKDLLTIVVEGHVNGAGQSHFFRNIDAWHLRFATFESYAQWYKAVLSSLARDGLAEPHRCDLPPFDPRHGLPFVQHISPAYLNKFLFLDLALLYSFTALLFVHPESKVFAHGVLAVCDKDIFLYLPNALPTRWIPIVDVQLLSHSDTSAGSPSTPVIMAFKILSPSEDLVVQVPASEVERIKTAIAVQYRCLRGGMELPVALLDPNETLATLVSSMRIGDGRLWRQQLLQLPTEQHQMKFALHELRDRRVRNSIAEKQQLLKDQQKLFGDSSTPTDSGDHGHLTWALNAPFSLDELAEIDTLMRDPRAKRVKYALGRERFLEPGGAISSVHYGAGGGGSGGNSDNPGLELAIDIGFSIAFALF